MIALLRGVLLEKRAPWILLDVAGVGYEIEAPMSVFYQLEDVGEELSLSIHQVVRDDALKLYGFSSRFERDLFRALIRVNGIGPKSALSLLSGIESDQLVSCIEQQDVARLVKTPGIGKKTAERLIIEMPDRLAKIDSVPARLGQPSYNSAAVVEDDAVAALESLGYKNRDAVTAIAALPDRVNLSTEELIRQVLKRLAR